ncbi:MAG TPA: hypothetical protein VH599_13165 [Ktedonobacterales bacterium]|jgi:hypothetical protein
MSRSARKKNQRRMPPVRLIWRPLRLTAILAFLCLAIIGIGLAIVGSGQAHFGQSSQTTSACNPTLITTDNQAQPAKWFSINSGSAADILSAAQCSDMFQSASQGADLIANALQNGTLAAPVLVKPYRSDVGLAQFWVVPVVDKNNHPLALLTFFYNPQSRLIHEGEFDAVTGDMFYVNHSFPAVTATAAVAAVSVQQHVAVIQGRTPELIYFPGDFSGSQAVQQTLREGGTVVIDPIWRVPGADGVWHYVDHNGQAHLNTDFPVDPHYQPMPATTTTQ